jgi:hypothetical protein
MCWSDEALAWLSISQVHIARHIKDGSPAPIFGGPLELLTMTPWYVVCIA